MKKKKNKFKITKIYTNYYIYIFLLYYLVILVKNNLELISHFKAKIV